MSHNSYPPLDLNVDHEISLIDILRFFKSAWKAIAIFGLTGMALSIAYLAMTPNQYEASVQIAMAQIGAANNNNNNNNNNSPLGVNIEEPALLISRLSSPTSFTPEAIAACGLQEQANAGVSLSKSIKLTPAKGVASVVELKTFGGTPKSAQDCALGVFELIKTTQAQIVAPYIEEAKVKLADDEDRLQKAKDLVARSDKSGAAVGASYLSTRDEIRYLLDEITALKNILTSNQNRATRMVAPIYASDMPIAPKKRMALAAGLFSGLFLGLLLALARQLVLKLKSASGGVL
ncbi:MAG: Wzz/FepE/Etk N-terminal domain-containing protein [Polynucleobacter sp.]|uniref:Wzz/FepE/Etk N-terminal domain-containing protein n=1 Tax=Polynucleobacter sp. TaxID=2029855 RepID=UPI002724BC8E|nr:Wzz/FepE/Etk N-terminal domain-containing protein [Polynucleobacter sp.]MDO8714683.1 Wzz/FepE/Etk N-terminal domain-containing protein [Polynucleobacter sp.]